MDLKLRKIEVDTQTADLLETRAAERGVSVAELVAELAMSDNDPATVDRDQLAELDRRWTSVAGGGATVLHRAA